MLIYRQLHKPVIVPPGGDVDATAKAKLRFQILPSVYPTVQLLKPWSYCLGSIERGILEM